MSKKVIGTLAFILFLVLSAFFAPACSNNSTAKKPGETNGGSNQSPAEANEILKEINKLISSLEKKTASQKVPSISMDGSTKQGQAGDSQASTKTNTGQNQRQGQSGGQGQGMDQNQQEDQNQGSGQNQQGGQGQNIRQNQSNQQAGSQRTGSSANGSGAVNAWQEETAGLKTILRDWNTLEPEAVKAGLSTGGRDNFETSLEQLSKAIGQQNLEASFMAAITLYRDFGEVAKTLDMTVPPDLFPVKYRSLAAIAEAYRGNWSAADSHCSQIDAHWNQLRLQAQDADSKLVDRTEFSLQDIKQAVKSHSLELVALRGEIAINNLKELEDALSKTSPTQGQGDNQKSGKSQQGSSSYQQGGSQENSRAR